MTAGRPWGQAHGNRRSIARHPSALPAPTATALTPPVTLLTAAELRARTHGALALRTIRLHLATWARGGWPRVVRVPRAGRVGGRQWAVVAEDYERLVRGLGPPEEARVAA